MQKQNKTRLPFIPTRRREGRHQQEPTILCKAINYILNSPLQIVFFNNELLVSKG